MKAFPIQVLWHDKKPVFSVHFEPRRASTLGAEGATPGRRFATCSGDATIRIWRFGDVVDEKSVPEYLATLDRHASAVNVVRFSPTESLLATAGDDGTILLWRQAVPDSSSAVAPSDADAADIESWRVVGTFRGSTSDIYDLAWSPCGRFILTGSVDNNARVYHVAERRLVCTISEHKHYVQGVAWDPLGEYIVTESCDRSVNVHRYKIGANGAFAITQTIRHLRLPIINAPQAGGSEQGAMEITATDEAQSKTQALYCSEQLATFFRRPAFTPDGALLLTPAGMIKDAEGSVFSAAHVYARGRIAGPPIYHLKGFKKHAIAIAISPITYALVPGAPNLSTLMYRNVFAVATQDSIGVYDTQSLRLLAFVDGLHYATITDISWSPDGRLLMIASSDGYCSACVFENDELGEALGVDVVSPFVNNPDEIMPGAWGGIGGALLVVQGDTDVKEPSQLRRIPLTLVSPL